VPGEVVGVKTSTECPECGGAISVFRIFRQFTVPTHIKCGHCKTRLRVNIRGLRVFVSVEIAMYLVLAGLIVLTALWSQSNFSQHVLWIILGLLVYVVLEIGAAVLYVNFGKFAPREQRKKK
jgi:uncharacterized protein (DUF983 family)